MFENIPKIKFDLIIFNPPYLPDEDFEDPALFGGKRGYEVLGKFLDSSADFLNDEGHILITSSSLTKRHKVLEIVKNNLLELETIETQHIFFEDLYIDLIKKSELLKEFHKNKISDLKYFNHGKRGMIFTGIHKDKKIAIKAKKDTSKAPLSIIKEIQFLKKLNKYDIGPKLVFTKENYFAYEFVVGKFIMEFLEISSKKNIKQIILKIFDQMKKLDDLKINKYEMHHPLKHVLIDNKNKVTLLDFERAKYSENPKNVTQFSDFIISDNLKNIFQEKNLIIDNRTIMDYARKYKKEFSENIYGDLIKYIKSL